MEIRDQIGEMIGVKMGENHVTKVILPQPSFHQSMGHATAHIKKDGQTFKIEQNR